MGNPRKYKYTNIPVYKNIPKYPLHGIYEVDIYFIKSCYSNMI